MTTSMFARARVLAAAFAVSISISAGAAFSAEPTTVASQPTTVVGWRGNWTGKFPDADPPTSWSKLSKPMKELRCQAEKPKDERPGGVTASFGALTQWLVAGPFPAAGDAKASIDEVFVKEPCEPKEGEAVKAVQWKKIETSGSLLPFDTVFAKDMPKDTPMNKYSGRLRPPYAKPFVAYASTWIYSAMDTTLQLRVRGFAGVKIWINGEPLQGLKVLSQNNSIGGQFPCKFKKGWTQVFCKVRNDVIPENSWYDFEVSTWYIDLGLKATRPHETVSDGIAWATLLPAYHIANPLIVGDKILAMSTPGDLVCLRKSDGKVLWIRSTTYADAAGSADKQNANFAKVTPLVAQLNQLDAAYVEKGTLSEEAIQKRIDLHRQIYTTMAQVNPAKYNGSIGFNGSVGHYPTANMPTPVCDGKQVYVWSALGIVTCFDLDGNRKWIAMPGPGAYPPGRYATPALVDGKLIIAENPKDAHKGGLIALDARTGEIAWSIVDKNAVEPFSSLVPLKVGGEDCVLYGGRLVHGKEGNVLVENGPELIGHIPTPVIENGVLYGIRDSGGLLMKAKLPAALGNATMKNEGAVNCAVRMGMCGVIASPLYHEGLLYVVDQSGQLYVLDTEAQKLVYEKDLGLGKGWPVDIYHNSDWGWTVNYASPMLAGKYIYVLGLSGTTVILKPGREYKEVARNKIDDSLLSAWNTIGQDIPEHFSASPIAEGKRLYLRGGNYLYCIGER